MKIPQRLGLPFLLAMTALCCAATPAAAQSSGAAIEGAWQGTLELPAAELRIVFRIMATADNGLAATVDSPDQGVTGLPASEVRVADDAVRIEVEMIGAVFEGELHPADEALSGTWTQAGRGFPLTLERVDPEDVAEVRRPQKPEPPFPYATHNVTFRNEAAEVTLAGTLTLPRSDPPYPAVVLVSGSGPQDRNETLFGHEPFLLWADVLTRRGVAVLRYDDRGVGGSSGGWEQTTIEQRVGDVSAALDFLRNRDDIRRGEIGLLGHSEGALVASLVAARSDEPAFLVLLASSAVPGDELVARQSALVLETAGMSAAGAAEYETRMLEALAPLLGVPPHEALPDDVAMELRDDLRAAVEAMSAEDRAVYGATDTEALAATLDQVVARLSTPSVRGFLRYDPRAALDEVEVPVLALLGERDLQVPPEQNAPALRDAFADNPNSTVRVLPELNHLFQPAETGALAEYGQIETTVAPRALELVTEWVSMRTASATADLASAE